MLGKKKEKIEGNWDLLEEVEAESTLPGGLALNMLVNQGAAEFGEGLKAKKTVKPTKANMNPYRKATVLRVLTMEKMLFKSEIRVPPLMGGCFVASAMVAENGLPLSAFFLSAERQTQKRNGRRRKEKKNGD